MDASLLLLDLPDLESKPPEQQEVNGEGESESVEMDGETKATE